MCKHSSRHGLESPTTHRHVLIRAGDVENADHPVHSSLGSLTCPLFAKQNDEGQDAEFLRLFCARRRCHAPPWHGLRMKRITMQICVKTATLAAACINGMGLAEIVPFTELCGTSMNVFEVPTWSSLAKDIHVVAHLRT